METSREVLLPVTLETARQRLATALEIPLVVQSGNLLLAKIVCSGRIESNELRVQYVEYGRSAVYLDLTGHIQEAPGGVRLRMSVSFEDSYRFLLYLPLGLMTLFLLLSRGNSDRNGEWLVRSLFFFVLGGLLTYLMRTLTTSFSQMRITRLEGIIVKIITGVIKTNPPG